jgi:hypothetical protein
MRAFAHFSTCPAPSREARAHLGFVYGTGTLGGTSILPVEHAIAAQSRAPTGNRLYSK